MCIKSVIWGILLIFAFPLAYLFLFIYIFFNCWEPCCSCIIDFNECVLKVVQFPNCCCDGIITGKVICFYIKLWFGCCQRIETAVDAVGTQAIEQIGEKPIK